MSILLKGYSTPKFKFCNLSLSPMWLQTRKSFVRLREHNVRYFDENREACESTIDCQVNNTVKAQKSMKDIVKIVHLLQEYFLYEKKTKNNDFILQFISKSYSIFHTKINVCLW